MNIFISPTLAANPYASEIEAALPRVLAMADTDPLNTTLGLGDRQFWAWKLIDFPNGTLQGPVNGLSALMAAGAFASGVDLNSLRRRIEDGFSATLRIMRRDGSFEEALPFEQSYCVTALVLYDHLQAARRLGGELIARTGHFARAVDFLVKRDETHGFISNHLATAAAALLMWDRMHGDIKARNKAGSLIDRIVERQSAEGWFDEYGGADPGYQTLCMTHLAEAALLLDSPKLWLALERACDFLAHFTHPDGSFGGIYGSRATRIYYPAGMELLAARFSSARALAEWMRPAIGRKATVTLAAIDAPNLSPVFNNYCEALLNAGHLIETHPSMPAPEGRHVFPDAGLLVDRGTHHYSVISMRKSVIYHWRDAKLDTCDAGLILSDDRRQILTSQGSKDTAVEVLDDKIILHGTMTKRSIPTPNPYNFLVLRLLTLSIMRIPWTNGFIKTMIARLLVQAGGRSGARFRRTVTLGMDLSVSDDWEPQELKKVSPDRPFSAIHMASSGYWQRGDTELRPE